MPNYADRDSDKLIMGLDEKELQLLQEGEIWRAFLAVIEDRIEIIRNELEVGKVAVKDTEGRKVITTLTHDDIKRRQGECTGLRYLLELPGIARELKQQKAQEKKEE